VSTLAKPVTVIAEVALKIASKKLVADPDAEDIGIIKRAVPMRIRTVKAIAISLVADSCERVFIAGSNLYLLANLRFVSAVIF
jgi:hypothetical protein